MKYKIIAMDLDGTLLNDDKKVTKVTQDTLYKYKKLGYLIVAVTARVLASLTEVCSLDIFDYLILNNGSCLYDVKEKKWISENKLDRKTAITITNMVEPYSEQIDYCTGNRYYLYKRKSSSNASFIKNIDSLAEVEESIVRMNVFLKEINQIDNLQHQIEENYHDVNSFIMQDSTDIKKWLVINPRGIDKKIALCNLANKLQISLSEIIFFGDGLNDLILSNSDIHTVAMGNALKEVKESFDDVTKSNNEDGIADYLEKHLAKIQ